MTTGRRHVLRQGGTGRFFPHKYFDFYADFSPTEQVFFCLDVFVRTAVGVFNAFTRRRVTLVQVDELKRIRCVEFVPIGLFFEASAAQGAAQLDYCYVDGLQVNVSTHETNIVAGAPVPEMSKCLIMYRRKHGQKARSQRAPPGGDTPSLGIWGSRAQARASSMPQWIDSSSASRGLKNSLPLDINGLPSPCSCSCSAAIPFAPGALGYNGFYMDTVAQVITTLDAADRRVCLPHFLRAAVGALALITLTGSAYARPTPPVSHAYNIVAKAVALDAADSVARYHCSHTGKRCRETDVADGFGRTPSLACAVTEEGRGLCWSIELRGIFAQELRLTYPVGASGLPTLQ